MYKITLSIAILLFASSVFAEDAKEATKVTNNGWQGRAYANYGHGWGGWGGWNRGGWGGWGNHSSTAAEGFMRGQGARAAGYGQWLRALGVYENQHQEALHKHYENEDFRIKKYWEVKKFYEDTQLQRRISEAERNSQIRKSKIAAEEERLNDLEALAALEARKEALRNAGLLPAKQKQSFVVNGKDYGSYLDFKKTDDYIRFMAAVRWKAAIDEAKEKMEAEKQEEALRFLAKRAMLTPGEEMKATEMSRARRQLVFTMGEAWVKQYIDGEPRFWEHLETLDNASQSKELMMFAPQWRP